MSNCKHRWFETDESKKFRTAYEVLYQFKCMRCNKLADATMGVKHG
jgi:hypothetical protein